MYTNLTSPNAHLHNNYLTLPNDDLTLPNDDLTLPNDDLTLPNDDLTSPNWQKQHLTPADIPEPT